MHFAQNTILKIPCGKENIFGIFALFNEVHNKD